MDRRGIQRFLPLGPGGKRREEPSSFLKGIVVRTLSTCRLAKSALVNLDRSARIGELLPGMYGIEKDLGVLASVSAINVFPAPYFYSRRTSLRGLRYLCARHSVVSCACRRTVLEIRTWQCPICGANASPLALRIDKFLQEVREQLEGQGTLEVRKLLVDADGV